VKPKTVDNALMRIRKKANDSITHNNYEKGLEYLKDLQNEEQNTENNIGIGTCTLL
jgi:hypothetical protein